MASHEGGGTTLRRKIGHVVIRYSTGKRSARADETVCTDAKMNTTVTSMENGRDCLTEIAENERRPFYAELGCEQYTAVHSPKDHLVLQRQQVLIDSFGAHG